MSAPEASPTPLRLLCAQCHEPIAVPERGLYALLPPPPPHAGYREVRAVHRRCAAEYEETLSMTIPWLPLERLWPRGATDGAS